MNLHAIVAPVIAAVNPWITGSVKVSTGFTTAGDGTRTPTYATTSNVLMQVQAVPGSALEHLDSLNIQGLLRAVYMNGAIEGLDRPAGKGGDVLVFASGAPVVMQGSWLVVHVLEPWDAAGWCKVIVQKQNP